MITIRQEPTSPNMANNNLVYEVTSDKTGQPQYQFVMDIKYYGSSDILQRVKQQPNPYQKGVFDIGQIVSQYLDSDETWKTPLFATSSDANKLFSVYFGEEYGTSISSSILLYNGLAPVTGSPAQQGDRFTDVTNGLVDYPNAINFNFDSGSYVTMESASLNETFTYNHNLSNANTTQLINDGDYATIALYNGNFTYPESDVLAQDIYFVQYNVYNAAGTNIQNFSITNTETNGGGPRLSDTDLWGDVAGDQTPGTRLVHIGVGPQNIDDGGNTLDPTWAYYTVKVLAQDDAGLDNSNGIWETLRFDKSTGECAYNGVRFTWKNEFGVWDYYTFTLQSSADTSIERQSYEQTFVDFSTSTNGVPYDKQRRGQSQFYNALNQRKTANTTWLNQSDADWLKELFYSTNVYIQNGSTIEPVVIISANVVEKTNPRTQKNFQYTIEFQPANQPRPRL